MLDVGLGEMLGLIVVALLVIGPDKLPRYAADAARFLRQIRRVINNAREEVSREIGPELQDLSLAELNPRSLLRKHVLDPDDEDLRVDLDEAPSRRQAPARRSEPARQPELDGETPPPYDPDTT